MTIETHIIVNVNTSIQFQFVVPPAREVKPTVGLMPARLLWSAGQVMLPSVSVPKVTVASPIDAATPDPDEDPHGSAFTKYAFVVWPPLPDHPEARFPLNSANSDKFVFPAILSSRQRSKWHEVLHIPKIIAPAARKRFTTPASAGTIDLRRLKDPAVVFKPGEKKKMRL